MIYRLELEQTDVLIVMRALGELPIKVGVGTFNKVQAQANEQDEAQALSLQPAAAKRRPRKNPEPAIPPVEANDGN